MILSRNIEQHARSNGFMIFHRHNQHAKIIINALILFLNLTDSNKMKSLIVKCTVVKVEYKTNDNRPKVCCTWCHTVQGLVKKKVATLSKSLGRFR